jgi:hypothetical protein
MMMKGQPRLSQVLPVLAVTPPAMFKKAASGINSSPSGNGIEIGRVWTGTIELPKLPYASRKHNPKKLGF